MMIHTLEARSKERRKKESNSIEKMKKTAKRKKKNKRVDGYSSLSDYITEKVDDSVRY